MSLVWPDIEHGESVIIRSKFIDVTITIEIIFVGDLGECDQSLSDPQSMLKRLKIRKNRREDLSHSTSVTSLCQLSESANIYSPSQ